MSTRTYALSFLLLTSVGIGLIAAFNWIIDPFDRNALFHIKGVNEIKPEFVNNVPVAKAGISRRIRARAIVLGTSRAEQGIDPDHPGWSTKAFPRYNLAMAGAKSPQIVRLFEHAQAVQPLQQVVMGMDFFLFHKVPDVSLEEDKSLLFEANKKNGLDIYLGDIARLISLDMAKESWNTINKQDTTRLGFDEKGRTSEVLYEDRLRKHGNQRHAFLASWKQCLGITPSNKKKQTITSQSQPVDLRQTTLDDFRSIVRNAYRNSIDLRLFISPTHAWEMECEHMQGEWPQYEEWERLLVNVLQEEAAAVPGAKPFPLWDFSGYNSVTTEAVPSAEDGAARMRGYWESSHYRREVGKWVLDRIFGVRSPGSIAPDDFGVLLTPGTIESHLIETRAAQQRYIESHPQDIAELKLLFNQLQTESTKAANAR